MSNKEVIDSWIDYVSSQWLNYRDKPRLCPSTENLIRKMEQKCNDRQYDAAWKYIEDLERLHDRFHDENRLYSKEPAQIFVECAIASYKMGNTLESIRLFDAAISNCTDAHDKAVIRWLRGCVYWYMGNSLEAITNWEDGLNDFEEQAKLTQRNAQWADWYTEKIKEMKDAIQRAIIENDGPPPPPTRATSTGGGSGSPGTGAGGKPIDPLQSDVLRAFSVSEEIPAGGFGPTGVDPNPIGYIDFDQFLIDNRLYRIVSLRGGNIIDPHSNGRHFVVKVKGDSMTKEGIDNGNFVLLRQQNTADNNDIVAAEIVGVNTEATLKRFIRREGKIFLQYRSNNPDYTVEGKDKEDEFTKTGENFYVRGIAIAVFKLI